jgi:hypothetical protein
MLLYQSLILRLGFVVVLESLQSRVMTLLRGRSRRCLDVRSWSVIFPLLRQAGVLSNTSLTGVPRYGLHFTSEHCTLDCGSPNKLAAIYGYLKWLQIMLLILREVAQNLEQFSRKPFAKHRIF